MTLGPGEYRQNGYIVPQLETAVDEWTRNGIGPFYILDMDIARFSYKDSTSIPSLRVALGNFGAVQLELIEQVGRVESPYMNFLDQHPAGGLHHISVWSDDYDGDLERWSQKGWVPDCSGEVRDLSRFCYFGSSQTNGTAIEVADARMSELFLPICSLIRDSSETWDGSDPLRSPDELFAKLG